MAIVAWEEQDHKEQDQKFPQFDVYNSMAYYVAKELHISPAVILDEWSVPMLIVAFGNYANEATYSAYQSWLSNKNRKLSDRPREYIVQFIGFTDE